MEKRTLSLFMMMLIVVGSFAPFVTAKAYGGPGTDGFASSNQGSLRIIIRVVVLHLVIFMGGMKIVIGRF